MYAARWLSRASRPHAPHRPLRFALLGASKCPDEVATAVRLHSATPPDYVTHPCYRDSHPRSSRGVSGDDPEGGAGSGVLRQRLVTARPGRPGKSPARHYDLAARSSLHGSGGNVGEGSAAPGEKPPRWSAERRASRVMGRKAPRKRLVRRVMAYLTGVPPSTRTSLGAPPTPRFGVSEAKVQTPGAGNAPRERGSVCCLRS